MKIRADVAALLRQGLSDRAIAEQLHVDASRTVAPARAALGLSKTKRGYKPAPTLEAAFRARTEPVEGGHLRWTGYRQLNGAPTLRYGGRNTTAHRVAFRLRTGREAVGKALPECGYEGCVEPSHVDDAPGRARTRDTYAAIFGQGAAR